MIMVIKNHHFPKISQLKKWYMIEHQPKNRNKIVVIIPAYNEEQSIGTLIDELKEIVPYLDIVVVNDGSRDETAPIARSKNVVVLDLPCNLGVGGAVQAGFRYTYEKGYDLVIRADGDGQHPPQEIPTLIDAISRNDVDLVIGSRYIGKRSYDNTTLRSIGIKALAFFLSVICRSKVTDPTSGFWVIKRELLYYFAHDYPSEYPEPEAIALLRRHGYEYLEVPVQFRPRTRGKSTIHGFGAIYYMLKVGLALIIDRIRPLNRRFEKARLKDA